MLRQTSSGFTALHRELNHTALVLYPSLKVSAQEGVGTPWSLLSTCCLALLLGVIPHSPMCGPQAYKLYDCSLKLGVRHHGGLG